MRIQFKDVPAADFLFQGIDTPCNELGKIVGWKCCKIASEEIDIYDTRFFAHQ